MEDSDFQSTNINQFQIIHPKQTSFVKTPSFQHPTSTTHQNQFKFLINPPDQYVQLNSKFDSGNLGKVVKTSDYSFRISPSNDCSGTKYQGSTKSWFYFKVKGIPSNVVARFTISNVNILLSVYNSKDPDSYRPVTKVQGKEWQRLNGKTSLNLRQQLQLSFDYKFKSTQQIVYFALCYPFSYEDNIKYLKTFNSKIMNQSFYFHKQILIKTPQSRLVHLLTITEGEPDAEYQGITDQFLFPEKDRPFFFKKPTILITARVHPGETPASYALQGILQFIISKDIRACILRKMFVIKVVPMLNPDGVFHGHYRMDIFNQNLNRYYNFSSPQKQPAIYAVKTLVDFYTRQGLMSFYFDLHAHGSKKGNFIYGNAYDDFVHQVQNFVFCKLLSLNCPNFQLQSCNFSKKHMKARDRFQELTKQGCGRVVVSKVSGIIHSFTLQCGLVSSNSINCISQPCNQNFKIQGYDLITNNQQDSSADIYSSTNPPLFNQDMYRSLGKALLISILDTFDRNPHSRVYTSQFYSQQNLRRLTAFQVFHQQDRFRMFQQHTYRKVKNIKQLIEQQFLNKFQIHKSFCPKNWQQLKQIQWPLNIQPLAKYNPKKQQLIRQIQSQKQEKTNSQQTQPIFMHRKQQYQTISKDLDRLIRIMPYSVKGIKNIRSQKTRNNSVYQLQMGRSSLGLGVNVSSIPSYLMNPALTTIKKQINQQMHTTIKSELKKQMQQIRVQIKGEIKQQIIKQIKSGQSLNMPPRPEIKKLLNKTINLNNKNESKTIVKQHQKQKLYRKAKTTLRPNLPKMSTFSNSTRLKDQSDDHYFQDDKLKSGNRLGNKLPELSAQKVTFNRLMEYDEKGTDLNQMIKKTLRWQAMRMKQLVKYNKK